MLIGGAGNDFLVGGKGSDIFVFDAGFGRDRIKAYQDGVDMLDFSGHSGIDSFLDLQILATDHGVRILDGDGNSIDLVGIDQADIGRDDFLF